MSVLFMFKMTTGRKNLPVGNLAICIGKMQHDQLLYSIRLIRLHEQRPHSDGAKLSCIYDTCKYKSVFNLYLTISPFVFSEPDLNLVEPPYELVGRILMRSREIAIVPLALQGTSGPSSKVLNLRHSLFYMAQHTHSSVDLPGTKTAGSGAQWFNNCSLDNISQDLLVLFDFSVHHCMKD